MGRFQGLVASIREARRARIARLWIVRLDAGYLSRQHEQRLRQWVTSPDNLKALHHAGGLWNDIDHAVLADRLRALKLASSARRPPARPRALIVSALAIGTIALVVPQTDLWIALWSDARTGYGESRVISLDDGSRITLDSHSAVDIAYSTATRRIRLLEGRAQFDVAPAPGRPFLVEADGGMTRALGTTFIVDADSTGVGVTAVRHTIEVAKGSGRAVLQPGEAIRYDGRLGQRTQAAPDADAWTRGLVIFRDAPLADIAVSLQRYTDRRIIVWGAARDRRFSGVIRTADPLGGINAMTRSAGLRLRLLPGVAIITLS